MEKETKERLMEEKYCIICYEPIDDSELVEIPTQSYEPDKSALDRDPNNREYVRALGEAIFESGDKETGIEYLSKAMASSLPNSGIFTELATAYLSLGDIERARLCAERAVAIRPDDIMAWAVLQKTHVFGNESSHGTAS